MGLLYPKPVRAKKGPKLRELPDGTHEWVYGFLAHAKRRVEIYRQAGGDVLWPDESDPGTIEDIQPAMCQGCEIQHPVGWNSGDWSHDEKRHCDCLRCCSFVCRKAHRAHHGRNF